MMTVLFLFCHDLRRNENECLSLMTSYGPSLEIREKWDRLSKEK